MCPVSFCYLPVCVLSCISGTVRVFVPSSIKSTVDVVHVGSTLLSVSLALDHSLEKFKYFPLKEFVHSVLVASLVLCL